MNQQKAEQQAREICHKEGSYWYQVETEITTALLAAYQEGKKDGEDRVKELEAALRQLAKAISENSEWDDGCFYYHGHAASELIDPMRDARAALEAKSEGVGE